VAAGDRWLEAMGVQRYVRRRPPTAVESAEPPVSRAVESAEPPVNRAVESAEPPVSRAVESAEPTFTQAPTVGGDATLYSPLPRAGEGSRERAGAPDPAPDTDREPLSGWESAPFPEWLRHADSDRPPPVEAELSPAAARAARIATLDWDALQAEVAGCTACPLHAGRTQAVFGVGSRQADWLIIGEAPGADEDRLGEPFVGRAGQLLNAMLAALGLQREDVYIANILKSRPPNNRDPQPAEIAACRPYLERQIALLQPGIILAIGRIAAQTLLQTETPVGKLRGRVHRLAGSGIPLIVSYHPAYLLRSPREKRKSWDDLQLARRTLAATRSAAAGG